MTNLQSYLSKTCSWLLICTIATGGGLVGGCRDSSDSRPAPTPPDPATFRMFMGVYDPALEELMTQMDRVETTVQAFDTTVNGTNVAATNQAADDMDAAIDDLSSAVANLEYLETRLQSKDLEVEGRITQPLLFTVIGVGLAVYGTWKYAQKLKQLSNDVSGLRKERDEAATDTMAGVPGGSERLAATNKKLRDKGVEASETVVSQTGEQLLPGAVQTTLGIKDLAGDAYQGIKVFTATKACATAPHSSDCKLTKGRTDQYGRLVVPSSELAVILSKPGMARVAIKMVDARSGGTIPVVRESIPIELSNPTVVAENDLGNYGTSYGGSGGAAGVGGRSGTGVGGTPSTQTTPVINTTLSGTFPTDPFNGMQLAYTISGVGPCEATDSYSFTTSRSYAGPLGSGTLRIAGTASQSSGYGASVSVSVSVDGGNSASDSIELVTPGDGTADTWDFDVSVPIPNGAKAGSVGVFMTGDYNAGTRGLNVSGSFAPPAQ